MDVEQWDRVVMIINIARLGINFNRLTGVFVFH